MLIQLKNVTFKYNGSSLNALKGVDLDVKEGSFTLLCGVSGCGKSTLLRLIKRELKPEGSESGLVLYRGKDIKELSPRDSLTEIGYVPQNPDAGIITDKVFREIAFTLESLGKKDEEISLMSAEVCGFLGINDLYDSPTDSLSGGQKQLVNLASAIVARPKLLLLDEPTSQLDPVAASSFLAALKRVNDELGITVLIAEHRLEEALPLADKFAVMEEGKLLHCGEPKEVAQMLYLSGAAIAKALPTSVAAYCEANGVGALPFTVKEGIAFMESTFPLARENEALLGSLKNEEESYAERGNGQPEKEKQEIFSLNDCYFRYSREGKDILKGLDLSVKKGDFLCILGGNGAGKSTLLKVLGGLLTVYAGKLRIFGKKRKELGASLYRGGVCLLPQNPRSVFVKDKLEEDLKGVFPLMEGSQAEKESLLEKYAERLDIKRLYGSNPLDLSGGETQKAALVKLMLLSPKVLLLDEPTKGMDASAKEEIARLLKGLNADGVTIVCATHDTEFAANCASSCGMYFDGKLALSTPREFFAKAAYYTTAASRIAKSTFPSVINRRELIEAIHRTGEKNI